MITWFIDLPIFQEILFVYVIAVTVVTFFYFGVDKMRSQVGDRRIRERTLWILCFIGGSLGGLLGMHFFRHKTKKLSFQTMLAVILMIQIIILYFLFR
jgi:uncharacterized membrane protein YsdA (DUF1294 family)